MGGISAGTSLLGGIFGSHAASDAAKTEQQAATKAGQQVTDATNAVNPTITAAAATSGQNAVDAAAAGGAGAVKAAGDAATNANASAADAAAGANTAATNANNLLNPYVQSGNTAEGVLNAGVAQGGEFNKTPTQDDLQIDPGYAFQGEQQGEQALERSAAAHGAVDSGGYAKDLLNYSQGEASQEYQAAFNRFETSTQNKFADVNAVANAGQNAANTSGSNLINAAQYGGSTKLAASEYGGTAGLNAAEYAGTGNLNASEFQGTGNTNATRLNAHPTPSVPRKLLVII